ncbi:MAG: AAA family ATPase [Rivularia sp. (in: Bacteria)]|nr:AAA family ATPase [Rivularia sp. MS3]
MVHIQGYQINEQLYNGSRTLVYRAVRENDQKPVVIKVLQNAYPSFNELLQFRNQYTIAKNLDIHGIVRPYSLESLDNSYALVMEDFGGVSLDEYMQMNNGLCLQKLLSIVVQVSDILHNLHQNRVVHKDIKPANILINPETQQVKLIDFSIASLLPKESQEIKNPNSLEGTLAYISPEQTGRMNRGIDYRADFYALGVTFYELLTGKLPFQSDDAMELLHCHIAKNPPVIKKSHPNLLLGNVQGISKPHPNSGVGNSAEIKKPHPNPLLGKERGQDFPQVLSDIVMKMMAKNAEDRYQSALGLKHDLEICLYQLKDTGNIASFEIAQRDISERFLIPEKLYGRENEVQQLLSAFERVSNGYNELMLVAGFSGIGKTAVVNEVHKPIVKQRGYFIKGKFDQFNRNIPLDAFVQAFKNLVAQLRTESDVQLSIWKSQILMVLGDNAQVIIDVIPELEQIIGKQSPVTELSGTAAQNRFNSLFQKFIQVFTTKEHPLVIFLDDLQWADSASLKLMQLLMSESENAYLFLIGAYRDNEVFPAHPLMLTLEEIDKAEAAINTITLAPLNERSLNQLVADTLNCLSSRAEALTQLIYQKTQGNPFFSTQFLKYLYEDGLIKFNFDDGFWQCDISEVIALALTDNVVEFMALQLYKLSESSQNILKLAACIGNQFDLNTLAIVCEKSEADAAVDLWKALQFGLILPQSEVYKFYIGEQQQVNQKQISEVVNYKFLHDRVQQAAYSLIPDDKKQATHLKIGQLLLEQTSKKERDEKLFDIVNHLNVGKSLITQPSKRSELAQLNLEVGRKAKSATAYSAAIAYFNIGIELLEENCWESQYELTLALYQAKAEAIYLNGEFEQLDAVVNLTLQSAKSLLDKIATYETQIQACMAQNQLSEAIKTALDVLKKLGIDLPQTPNMARVLLGLAQTKLILAAKKPQDLANLPTMTNPEKLAAMRILSSALSAAFIGAPKLLPLLVFQQVNLSIKYGNMPLSAFAYAWYGTILCGVVLDINTGYEFGQLAVQVLEQFHAQNLRCKTIFMVNSFINHWKQHLKSTFCGLQEAYQSGIENGDVEYGAWSALLHGIHLYFNGRELFDLEQTLYHYGEAVKQSKQNNALVYINIYRQCALNLMGKTPSPSLFDGPCYSETDNLPTQIKTGDRTGIFFYYVNQLQLHYLFSEFETAVEIVNRFQDYEEAGMALLPNVALYLYDSLARLALYSTAIKRQRLRLLNKVRKNQKKLKKWADFAPMNSLHKWNLVEAERYRVLGKYTKAMTYYDCAISGAKENGYCNEEALANELAGQFYLEWNKQKVAAGYMQEAYYCYSRWGAKAKTDDLEKRYPDLLRPIFEQATQVINPLETLTTIAAPNFSIHSSTTRTSTSSTSINAALDFAAIIKASQALSSTIEQSELLSQLTQIILQNSGGDYCALILPNTDSEWCVQAIATPETIELCSQPLDGNQNLPVKLINYVKNTQQLAVIDNLKTDSPVIDEYFDKQQPSSILCLPILAQGHLMGILYLKNSLASGVFSNKRLLILNFLCTQAAISLENARLYQQAQIYAQQLEESQLQVVQNEKMATLGNLVAGVAHEVNNPIGFLTGSISNAEEYLQDLFAHLELYQQEYPETNEEIQENAEDIDLEFLLEDLPKLLDAMKAATERIKSISNSLRTFSRADTEHKVRANLHDGINSTLLILKYRLKANEKRPAIIINQEYGEIPEIECFPGQLNQVFMNILANAIDMFDEMSQNQTYKELEANLQQITIRTQIIANQVCIQICDNGKGMSEEVRKNIFKHLFTTKAVGKGTGLGLAIAKQIIVEKHDGIIEVNSEVGEGTEFIINIPIN